MKLKMLLIFVAIAALNFASVIGDTNGHTSVYTLSIKALESPQQRRIGSFRIELTDARCSSLQDIPSGWTINVYNNSNGNTIIEGSIDVGAAAENLSFIQRTIRITAPEGADHIGFKGEVELMDYHSPTNISLAFKRPEVVFVPVK